MFGIGKRKQSRALPRYAKERVQPDFTDVEVGGRSHTRNRWEQLQAEYAGETSSGRSAVITTDRDLQLGPAPNRINRVARLNVFGASGPCGINTDNPMQRAYMGHVPIMRRASLPVPRKLSDDRIIIPAVYVGKAAG